MQNIGLSEQNTTDTQRHHLIIKKRGCITLPYTEEVLTEQLVATRVERITPLLLSSCKELLNLTLLTIGLKLKYDNIVISVAHDFDFALQFQIMFWVQCGIWQSQWSGL